jgi:hypothetical protein
MDGGNYEARHQAVREARIELPVRHLRAQAQMEIAYAYYKAAGPGPGAGGGRALHQAAPEPSEVDYMYYLRGLVNFNDQLGFLSIVYAQDPTERDPKGDARSLRRLQGAGRQVPEQRVRAGFDRAHEVPGQRDGPVRSARGQLLLPPRRLSWPRSTVRRAPSPTTGRAGARRSAVHDDAQLRQAGHAELRDDAQRVFRRTTRTAPSNPNGQGGEAPGGSSGPSRTRSKKKGRRRFF